MYPRYSKKGSMSGMNGMNPIIRSDYKVFGSSQYSSYLFIYIFPTQSEAALRSAANLL